MSVLFITGLAAFVHVFLRAGQQRNVMGLHYLWVLPFSVCMAYADLYVMHVIAEQGYDWLIPLIVGLAAGTGAMLSMYLHARFISKGATEIK